MEAEPPAAGAPVLDSSGLEELSRPDVAVGASAQSDADVRVVPAASSPRGLHLSAIPTTFYPPVRPPIDVVNEILRLGLVHRLARILGLRVRDWPKMTGAPLGRNFRNNIGFIWSTFYGLVWRLLRDYRDWNNRNGSDLLLGKIEKMEKKKFLLAYLLEHDENGQPVPYADPSNPDGPAPMTAMRDLSMAMRELPGVEKQFDAQIQPRFATCLMELEDVIEWMLSQLRASLRMQIDLLVQVDASSVGLGGALDRAGQRVQSLDARLAETKDVLLKTLSNAETAYGSR